MFRPHLSNEGTAARQGADLAPGAAPSPPSSPQGRPISPSPEPDTPPTCAPLLTASVVIITRNRPDMVRRCLEHVADQGALEILVVDASDDLATREVVDRTPGVRYLDLRGARNQMPASRNLGIAHCRGDVVAFLDDDSMARPGWLAALLGAYSGPEIGCVGGRAVDEHEPTLPDPHLVGRLLPDGTRIDNFNADPGRILEVDRVRGCNMSFRRELLLRLGGFDRRYTGTNVNEAGDMGLRVKNAGYKVLYEPAAVVDHLSAPREELPRDPRSWRTQYYLARNRTYFLLKNAFRPAVLRTLYLREIAQVFGKLAANGPLWVAAHLGGKIAGTLVALLPRATGIPREEAAPRPEALAQEK